MLQFPPRLYAITDARFMPGDELFRKVESALQGGCGWVQYRDKTSNAARRLQNAKQLRELCENYCAKLIINDDPTLAKASRAHGVHLGQTDMPIKIARALLGPDAIIGATCHASLELALAAEVAGANYLAFGRFFPSATKPHANPAPLALIPQIKPLLRSPIVTIGGITLENATQLLQAGADCLAVCEGLFNSDDITARARRFIGLLNGPAHG